MSQKSKIALPNLQRMRALSVFLLVGGLTVGVWLLLSVTQAFHLAGPGTNHSRFAILMMGATWLVLAAGSGALMVMVKGLVRWHRTNAQSYDRRWEEGIIKIQAQEEATRLTLESQLMESKRAEDGLQKANREMQERIYSISRAHDSLQEELNKRKRAEKELGQQRQELERTKDILELHVQARTQALQKLQHLYESILNSAGEGICGLDLEGRITFANPAAGKISGWSIEELIGKELSAAFSGLKQDAELKDLGQTTLSEQVLNRKNGSEYQAEYMQTPIHESGRLIGAVVVFKDITERKTAQQALTQKAAELTQKAAELTRSNAELEQFAFVASHDLQEPLRKIQAFGDRLKAKCRTVELGEGWDYLERMHNAAMRMQRLINDLLTFSRSIKSDQPFVPVDLNEATKEVLNDLEVRVEQTQATVEVGPLPMIDADPMQMRQLLQNLIGNALKFQPPNSKPAVKITANILGERPAVNGTQFINSKRPDHTDAGESERYCELIVQDNGIGFEEKYSERIFAVFQRLHGREEYEGTGVGLAVCRRIADRHRGTITARSKLGEGSAFSVLLPVQQTKLECA